MIAQVHKVQVSVATPTVARKSARGASAVVRANARDQAAAAVVALSVAASPLSATAAVEVAQVAKGDSKSAAAELFAAQQEKTKVKVTEKKTKKLAAKGPSISLPSFSAPSISLPSFGGAKKAAPTKAAAAPAKKAESGSGSNLGLILAVLFSPLIAVQAVSFQTMARLAKQSADK